MFKSTTVILSLFIFLTGCQSINHTRMSLPNNESYTEHRLDSRGFFDPSVSTIIGTRCYNVVSEKASKHIYGNVEMGMTHAECINDARPVRVQQAGVAPNVVDALGNILSSLTWGLLSIEASKQNGAIAGQAIGAGLAAMQPDTTNVNSNNSLDNTQSQGQGASFKNSNNSQVSVKNRVTNSNRIDVRNTNLNQNRNNNRNTNVNWNKNRNWNTNHNRFPPRPEVNPCSFANPC